ncbi:MAG TPA: hypothetical protein VJN68_05910, partial [Burkholderiaceae bacterium]|nr:hypothetical protein [Burkholderiaceae bacterium]
LADAYYELHRRRGHYAEALAASEAAVKAYDGYWGGRHHRATAARIHVALAELDLGRAADAWRNLETARARIDANGHHDDELRAVDVARARALTDLGRPQDAIDLLLTRASVAPTEDDPPAESELESRAERGRALMALGQKAEGRRLVIAASAGMQQAGWPSGLFKRYTVLLTDR